MCGIVGYLGEQDAQHILLDCLGRLEYRGYDSAGMATVADGKLATLRCVGDNHELQQLLERSPLPGQVGIAHTRWATHGRATQGNSHPHTDCSGTIAIVHNGIIENCFELKEELESAGHRFQSQTDSEIVAHLIECNIGQGLTRAVMQALPRLQGTYALAVICQQETPKIVAARHGGPPLVIGHCDNGIFVSSDVAAILHYTSNIQIIEDDEVAEISVNGAEIRVLDGTPVSRSPIQIAWQNDVTEKRGFEHYMLKEIHEQPQAVIGTVRGQTVQDDGNVSFPDADLDAILGPSPLERLSLVACGTSWHAALVGRHLLEHLAGVSVNVDVASEYRYRPQVRNPDALVVGISQSGETADTLGALASARQRGARVLGICNVAGSSMSRESDGIIYTHAGPEIGVASTKTFTCQITALLLLGIALGVRNGHLPGPAAMQLHREITQLSFLIKRILAEEEKLAGLAEPFDDCSSALYIGRGILHPLAIEGALKLKEISYIHAEAYPAGELKHGAIALIDSRIPVVALATKGPQYSRVLSAIQEVKARDGMVIAITNEGDAKAAALADHAFCVPEAGEMLVPILTAVPLQLLAYHVARRRGCPIDKPRNLAKSVTVE